MAEKTIVEKAAETVGYGLAMAEDVASLVKTAVGAALTTVTKTVKKTPPKKGAKKVTKKAAAQRTAQKALPAKEELLGKSQPRSRLLRENCG